jgi:transcriptional regulator with XRE-family HTH domain
MVHLVAQRCIVVVSGRGIPITERDRRRMMQKSLADRLRLLRAQRGLTVKDAAQQVGVDRHTLRRIELGTQEAQYPTLAKIAKGYGVPVEELIEEPAVAGKAEASREAGHADAHGLFAGHQATSGWRRAYDNSQRFRSQAKARLRKQLSLWETARDEGARYEERRVFLDAMGRILDEASSVSNELTQHFLEGLDGMLEPGPSPYWTEYQKAEKLYHELWGMAGEAGLSVLKKTEQAPGQLRHELLEVA